MYFLLLNSGNVRLGREVIKMFFVTLLSYFATKRVHSPTNYIQLGSFGFEGNSTFSLHFTVVGSSHLIYCLLTQNEFDLYPVHSFPVSEVCSGTMDFPSMKVPIQQSQKFQGTIENAGVYHQVVINCDDPETTPINTVLTVEQMFRNRSTRMDIRWLGIFKAKKIVIIVSLVLFGVWTLNWIWHHYSKIPLHGFFSLAFVMHLVGHIIRILELSHLDVSDGDIALTNLRIIWWLLAQLVLAFTCTLAAHGYCVICNTVSAREVAQTFALGAAHISLWTIYQNCDLYGFDLTILMIIVFCGALFVREILLLLNDSVIHTWVHLVAIANAGIEPRTTPVYLKYRKFRVFQVSIMVYCALITLLSCSSLFIAIPFWLTETIGDAVTLTFLTVTGFVFALHRLDMSGGYCYVVQADHSLDVEMDLEMLNMDTSELKSGGMRWQQGMSLPSEPVIEFPLSKRQRRFSRVRSASVDVASDPALPVE